MGDIVGITTKPRLARYFGASKRFMSVAKRVQDCAVKRQQSVCVPITVTVTATATMAFVSARDCGSGHIVNTVSTHVWRSLFAVLISSLGGFTITLQIIGAIALLAGILLGFFMVTSYNHTRKVPLARLDHARKTDYDFSEEEVVLVDSHVEGYQSMGRNVFKRLFKKQ
jgi:hypothetical protein